MEVVYLGLISKIFNAIFNAILSPVFKFISSLLEKVLGWLFRSVLQPLLINVLQPLFKGLMDLVMEIIGGIIYSIYADCLQIVDALQSGFRVFSGIDKVTYKGKSYTLLETLFRMEPIQKTMYILTAVCFVLMLMFAILGTVRSMADLDGEHAKPVSKVLSSVFKAMVKMFMIPTVSLFAIMMASQILVGINGALKGEETTLARMVFVVSSLDACKDSRYNVSGSGNIDIGINDSVRKKYYDGTWSYADKSKVKTDFDLGKFDYMIGFLGVGFLIVVLAICMISFITRVFDVIVLFLVSPLFASVMPLDDGEKFKAWQDMFVAKLFGGYGTVVGMQVYMMMCPAVMSGNIKFGEGSTEANYLIRMIFLLGGAWAVVKLGPTITQLLNYQAGSAEAETARSVTSGMAATASVMGNTVKTVGSAGIQAYKGWRGKKDSALAESDRRIQGRLKRDEPSGQGAGGGKGGVYRGQGSAGGQRGQAGPAMGRSVGTGGPGGQASPTMGRSVGSSTTGGKAAAGQSDPKKDLRVKKGPGQAMKTGQIGSRGFTMNKSKGGHSYIGFQGKNTKFGRDDEGRFHARLFGVGFRMGNDGKLEKVSLPFVRLKKDSAGKMHVSKAKIPLTGVTMKRAETVKKNPDGTVTRTMGNMYCSDSKIGGYKARYDQETGKVETLSSMGDHYGKDSHGNYVKTHTDSLVGGRTEYDLETGREVNHVGNFTERSFSYDSAGNRQLEEMGTIQSRLTPEESRQGRERAYLFRRTQEDGGDGS